MRLLKALLLVLLFPALASAQTIIKTGTMDVPTDVGAIHGAIGDTMATHDESDEIPFKIDGKSGDYFTTHDRLKLSDARGVASKDFSFTGVYDNDLIVSMPRCTVMFNGRIDTLSAQDVTLSASSHVYLYSHKDSTRNVTETATNPNTDDSAIRDHIVLLGEFYTNGYRVHLYKRPTDIADRWRKLNQYIDEVHGGLVISGLEVTIPNTALRELRMASGVAHYGLYHINVDSIFTQVDTTAAGDSTLVLHWGAGTGNDTTSHTQKMPVDSVFNYTGNQKVVATPNKWYKSLIWLDGGTKMAVQMANSASQSNTAAAALVADEPPINTDHLDHALRLYWLVFQTGADFSAAVLTDVRQIHGTGSGRVAANDHGELSGLGDDDHPQYLQAVEDSISLTGATLPHLDISFGDWVSAPEFTPSAEDTITVVARMDTIYANDFQPVMEAYVPDDTTGVIQIIDMFSPVYDVPPYFIGVDSIVFEYTTEINETDSCEVNIYVYEFADGVLTSLDTAVDLASAGAWTHNATLTSLTALTRYNKFIIRVDIRSIGHATRAKIGRMKVYWKEGS